jgi:hypothetical protein
VFDVESCVDWYYSLTYYNMSTLPLYRTVCWHYSMYSVVAKHISADSCMHSSFWETVSNCI